jgi:hypothetical protein
MINKKTMYTKQFFEENKEKWNVIPPLLDDFPTLKYIKIKLTKVSDVNVNTVYAQIRVGDDISGRSEELKQSFKNGIDWTRPLPIVIDRGIEKPDLVDAFGRVEYFEEEDIEYWPMLYINDMAHGDLIDYKSYCNRVLAQVYNTKQDLIEAQKKKVDEAGMPPTRKNFLFGLNRSAGAIPDIMKQEIVNILMDCYKTKTNPTPQNYPSLNSKTLMKRWINPHWKDSDKWGFRLEKDGRSAKNKDKTIFTGVIPFGYGNFENKLGTAVSDYLSTGLKTMFILGDGKKITGKKALEKNRKLAKKHIEKFKTKWDDFSKKSLNWDEAFGFIGFKPQDNKHEPVGYIVNFDTLKTECPNKQKNGSK